MDEFFCINQAAQKIRLNSLILNSSKREIIWLKIVDLFRSDAFNPLTPAHRSRITTVWYTGVATAMYAGSTVAVLASRYLTLEQGNGFLLTWMVVALSLNLVVIAFLGHGKSGSKASSS